MFLLSLHDTHTRFYNSYTYTRSSIALNIFVNKINSAVGRNFSFWNSDSERHSILFLSVAKRVTTIRLKR